MKHKGFGKYACVLIFGLALFSAALISTVFAEESDSTRFSVEILPSLSVSVSDVSIAAGNNLTTETSTITIASR